MSRPWMGVLAAVAAGILAALVVAVVWVAALRAQPHERPAIPGTETSIVVPPGDWRPADMFADGGEGR